MKLEPLPANKVIKVLDKLGFKIIRKKGSHVILKHPDGRVTTVPVHKGEKIGRGLLRKIIKDANVSKDEFMQIAKEV
ncbi:MAG: type II toxin-antitoxin system HicA family toxin [Thermoplasmata archaeon]|nr:MAG: type II toxin-antitoxin system HicA family toxin [Thermoplasmata archaeon]